MRVLSIKPVEIDGKGVYNRRHKKQVNIMENGRVMAMYVNEDDAKAIMELAAEGWDEVRSSLI